MKVLISMVIAIPLLLLGPACGADAPPRGWTLEGDGATQYETGTEVVAGAKGAQSAFLRAKGGQGSSATLLQRFNARNYAGKRVALSGALKTLDAKGAFLFITVGGNGKVLIDQSTAPLSGTNDRKNLAVVVDVPSDALVIRIGFGLKGGGTVWADGLSFGPAPQER